MLARMTIVLLPTWVILTVVGLSVFVGAGLWYYLSIRSDEGEQARRLETRCHK